MGLEDLELAILELPLVMKMKMVVGNLDMATRAGAMELTMTTMEEKAMASENYNQQHCKDGPINIGKIWWQQEHEVITRWRKLFLGAVEEMGVMVRGTNTELLICHGLHCTNKRKRAQRNRTAFSYRNNNVKETFNSVMHKHAVIWQKTSEHTWSNFVNGPNYLMTLP